LWLLGSRLKNKPEDVVQQATLQLGRKSRSHCKETTGFWDDLITVSTWNWLLREIRFEQMNLFVIENMITGAFNQMCNMMYEVNIRIYCRMLHGVADEYIICCAP
jgi:hypothetical protein